MNNSFTKDPFELAEFVSVHTTELLLTDSRGVYIPRDFVEIFSEELGDQLNEWERETMLRGPFDNPDYWDAWIQAETRGLTIDGKRVSLDGDLWLIDDDLRERMLSQFDNREEVEEQLCF